MKTIFVAQVRRAAGFLPLLIAGAACFVSGPTPVFAESLQLEEVVVTARKREESMQDAPVSVSAFSAESLSRRGINEIGALENITPGLDMGRGTSGASKNLTPYIRGVGQRLSQVVVDPSVAIYYAGVYQGRMLGTPLDVVDLASVEVLRGPQGTLFGKNVTGGAILMNPSLPADFWSVSIQSGLMSNEGEQHAITLNAPISENAAVRLNYNRVRTAGHIENVLNGKEHSDDNRETVVGQLRWDMSSDLTANLTYAAVRTREASRAFQCLFSADELGWDKNNFILLTLADNVIGTDFEATCDQRGPESGLDPSKAFNDVGLPFDRPLGNRGWKSLATPEGGNNYTESEQAILQFDYSLDSAPAGLESIRAITGWLRSGNSQFIDFDGTEVPLLSSYFPDIDPVDQLSQEFQFNFALLDDRLMITSGAYLFSEKTAGAVRQVPTVLGPLYNDIFDPASLSLPGLQSFPGIPVGGTAVFGIIRESLTYIDNEAAALYAQFDYSFGESVDVGVGLRWTHEKRRTETVDSELDPTSVHPNGLAPIFSQPRLISVWSDSFRPSAFSSWRFGQDPKVLYGEQTIRQWSPMINVKYTFSDELMDVLHLDSAQSYLTWSEGFRSGGIERGVDDDKLNEFAPEFVENIEVGIKTDALNRRFRANVSAYYSEYTDMQLVTTRGGDAQPLPFFVNAGKAIISGVEVEVNSVIGNHWILSANAAYTNADLKQYDALVFLNGNQQVQVDRSDEDMPRVSEKAGSFSLTYLLPVDSLGEFTFTASVNYRGEQTTHFDRGSYLTGEYLSESAIITNVRLGWTSPDEMYHISAYADNIDGAYTQKRTGGVPLVEATGAGTFGYTQPTVYGLSFKYDWRGL